MSVFVYYVGALEIKHTNVVSSNIGSIRSSNDGSKHIIKLNKATIQNLPAALDGTPIYSLASAKQYIKDSWSDWNKAGP